MGNVCQNADTKRVPLFTTRRTGLSATAESLINMVIVHLKSPLTALAPTVKGKRLPILVTDRWTWS